MEHFSELSQKILPVSDTTTILRFYIHQNDIRTDAADVFPGDDVILLFAPKAESARAGDDNGADSALGQLDPGIGHKA